MPGKRSGSYGSVLKARNFTSYLDKEKKKLDGILKIVKIDNHSNLVSAGHGYPHQPGSGKYGGYALSYHTCVILEGTDLKGAVAFAHCSPLGGKVSCPVQMKVRHLVISVMSRNKTVPILSVTVTYGILHWVQAIW